MILTLWEIDDEAGSSFAKTFYRSWATGETAAVAAARAREAARTVDPHPYRWAPFAVVG
jgi:CHAT domain-containing protein